MAPKYTIQAINSLSEVEKLRLVLAYLHHNEPKNVRSSTAAQLYRSHPFAKKKI